MYENRIKIPLDDYESYKGMLILIGENAVSGQDMGLATLYKDIRNAGIIYEDRLKEDSEIKLIEERLAEIEPGVTRT